jgi:hypothetical protein
MIISTKPFTVTSTEVSTKTSISTASAETSSLPVDTLTTLVPPPVDTTTTEAGTTEVGSTTEAGSTTDIGTPIDTSAPIPGTSESTHLVTQTLEPSSLTRDTTQTSIFWKTTTEKSIPSASPIISKVYEIKLSIGTPQRTRLSKATVVGASIGSLAAFFVMGLTLLWWLKKWRGSRVPMESVEQQPVKDIQQPKAELPATAPMSELPGGPG